MTKYMNKEETSFVKKKKKKKKQYKSGNEQFCITKVHDMELLYSCLLCIIAINDNNNIS